MQIIFLMNVSRYTIYSYIFNAAVAMQFCPFLFD